MEVTDREQTGSATSCLGSCWPVSLRGGGGVYGFDQAVTLRLTRAILAITEPPQYCLGGRGNSLSDWYLTEIKILALKRWSSVSFHVPDGIWLRGGFRASSRHHLRQQNSVLVETGTCHLPSPIALYIWKFSGWFCLSVRRERLFTCRSSLFFLRWIYESDYK